MGENSHPLLLAQHHQNRVKLYRLKGILSGIQDNSGLGPDNYISVVDALGESAYINFCENYCELNLDNTWDFL